jgi:hypothetical protein
MSRQRVQPGENVLEKGMQSCARFEPANRLEFLASSQFLEYVPLNEIVSRSNKERFTEKLLLAPGKFQSDSNLLTSEEWFNLPDSLKDHVPCPLLIPTETQLIWDDDIRKISQNKETAKIVGKEAQHSDIIPRSHLVLTRRRKSRDRSSYDIIPSPIRTMHRPIWKYTY